MGLTLAYGLVRTLAWLIFTIVMVLMKKDRIGPERLLLVVGGSLATLSAFAFAFANAGFVVPHVLFNLAVIFSTPAICLVMSGSLFAAKRLGLLD